MKSLPNRVIYYFIFMMGVILITHGMENEDILDNRRIVPWRKLPAYVSLLILRMIGEFLTFKDAETLGLLEVLEKRINGMESTRADFQTYYNIMERLRYNKLPFWSSDLLQSISSHCLRERSENEITPWNKSASKNYFPVKSLIEGPTVEDYAIITTNGDMETYPHPLSKCVEDKIKALGNIKYAMANHLGYLLIFNDDHTVLGIYTPEKKSFCFFNCKRKEEFLKEYKIVETIGVDIKEKRIKKIEHEGYYFLVLWYDGSLSWISKNDLLIGKKQDAKRKMQTILENKKDIRVTDIASLDDISFVLVDGKVYWIGAEPYRRQNCVKDMDGKIREICNPIAASRRIENEKNVRGIWSLNNTLVLLKSNQIFLFDANGYEIYSCDSRMRALNENKDIRLILKIKENELIIYTGEENGDLKKSYQLLMTETSLIIKELDW